MKRSYWFKLLLVTSILLNTSCFSPKVISTEESNCQLVTKKMTLSCADDEVVDGILLGTLEGLGNTSDPNALLVASVILLSIPVGTFIVSGSIVTIGNTIHWLEGQGRCEDSYSRNAVRNMRHSARAMGGIIIESYGELQDFLKSLPNDISEVQHNP